MNLKSLISFGLISFIAISEAALQSQRGAPPIPGSVSQFDYNYVEIYKPFFKKVRLPDGKIAFQTQRRQAIGQYFLVNKEKSLKRIFVLGGSVAGRFDVEFMRNLLERTWPNTKFEIIKCGMGGYDSYRESLLLEEVLKHSPDLIILMSGNNERLEPGRIKLFAFRVNRLLQGLWAYRILREDILKIHKKFIAPEQSATKEFNVSLVRRCNLKFEKNLNIMIRRAKRRKIPIAICTLPANFRDCPPGGPPPWDNRDYFWAWYALENRDFKQAEIRFKNFLTNNPEDAFGTYYLAQCYDLSKDYPRARAFYLKTLDLVEGTGDRTPPSRNDIIRRLCAQYDFLLIDLENAFMDLSPNGLVGKEFFYDHCHWWLKYNPLVCEEIVRAVIDYNKLHRNPIFDSQALHYNYNFSKQDYLKDSFALSGERISKYIYMAMMEIGPPDNISERAISYIKSAYELSPDLFGDILSLKEQVFKEFSTNQWIKEARNDLLRKFDEYWTLLLMHIGEAFRRMGLHHKAIENFDEAIRLNSNLWRAYLSRGIAYYKIGRIEATKRDSDVASKGEAGGHPLVRFYREAMGI